ncbi:hypothetical protein MMC13_004510 [Lambiella insularis]|nr:hypothetical protein [Lambiella insularis]
MSTPYQPPPGGLYVLHPRTHSDIVIRSLAIHLFALCAYNNLAQLLQWSTSSLLRIWQLCIFACFPEIVVVQLLHHALMYLHLRRRTPLSSFSLPYLLDLWAKSGLSGPRYRSSALEDTGGVLQPLQPNRRLRSRTQFPTLRLLFTFVLAGPLVVTIFAYKQRLSIRYMAATYVGNLLVDHRNGWVAIGGTIAATVTVLLLVATRSRISAQPATESLQCTTVAAPNIHDLSRNLFLLQAGLVSLIHLALLKVTNHSSVLMLLANIGSLSLYSIALAFVAVAVLCTLLRRRWSKLMSVLGAGSGGFAWLLIVAEAVVQLRGEVAELREVSEDRVQGWNYRWKVKDWGSGRG